MLTAKILLILLYHPFLLVITLCMSSRRHPVSTQLMCPILVCLFVKVCMRMLLWSPLLILQQSWACLACLSWIVYEMGSKWLYKCCFVGCCFQVLFKQHAAFLCISSWAFSSGILLMSQWCHYTIVLILLLCGRKYFVWVQVVQPCDYN